MSKLEKFILIAAVTAWVVCSLLYIAHAATAEITWDKNTEPELIGYRVYMANYSGNRLKFLFTRFTTVSSPPVRVSGLSEAQKHYFRVTAFSVDQETPYSNVAALLFIKTPANVRFQKIEIR